MASKNTKASQDAAILNKALEMAMEWGEYFMKPTQPRLAKLHPKLGKSELDAIDSVAREAMRTGHNFVYDNTTCTTEDVRRAVHEKYPWVSAQNAGRLHSQGMYYAMK